MRYHNPKVHYMRLAESITPKLRYDGKEDFFIWQKYSRKKLYELLGLEHIKKCDLDFLAEEENITDNYKEIRFSFQSEERLVLE